MKNYFIKLMAVAVVGIALLTACREKDVTVFPAAVAHFQNQTGGSFFILTAASVYNVPVGITTVSNKARTLTVSYSSPTSATVGTHFTAPLSITIPAGATVANLPITPVFAQYTAGRKDTLVVTMNGGDGVDKSSYNNTFKLFMRGPCFEGDVNLTELIGSYPKTNEDFGGAYGPYTTTISKVSQLTSTTGTITVTNVFDAGWNPITFILNWTDPANRTVTLTQQSGIGNAGTISATYAGSDISVRPFAGQVGTFSICNKTLTLRMQLGVTGVGFFGTLYTVNMAK